MSFFVLNIFSQNKLIVGKITFEGLKRTDPDYLIKQITLNIGDEWNNEKKEEITSQLLKIAKIIEEAEVSERMIDDKNVEIIIKIIEKSAFLIIPYFSYSNSRGLIPKAVFRYFNVGGYSKYIKSKVEFVPTESLNFNLRYEDPAVMEKPNINYYIDGWFKTSVLNYFANVNFIDNNPSNTTIKWIRPIGSFGNDGSQRWNRDLFYEVETTFGYEYVLPDFNYKFKPKISFLFRRVQERVDKHNDFVLDEIVQQTQIRPKIDFSTTFPIGDTGVEIVPVFYTSYEHYFGEDNFSDEYKESNYKDYSWLYSVGTFKIGQKLSVPILIKIASATLTPYVDFVYQKNNFYAHKSYTDYIMLDYYNQNYDIRENISDSVDYYLGLIFDKSLDFKNTYHRFKVQGEFTQRIFGHYAVKSLVEDGKVETHDFEDPITGDYITTKKYYNREYDTQTLYYLYYPRFFFQFSYWFDVTFLKNHVFKFRSRLFAKFNDRFEWDNYELRDDADDLVPGRIKGWAGWFLHFKYEIPLFEVKTPRWLTKSIKRQQKWGVFWDIYIDMGLAQNNEPDIVWDTYDKDEKVKFFRKEYDSIVSGWTDDQVADIGSVYYIKTSYTLDKDYLHLYPALAVGTNIRILPRFWPIEFRFTIAGSIWQIIRDKEITGRSVILEFSIEDAF